MPAITVGMTYNPYQRSPAMVVGPVHLPKQASAKQSKRILSFRPTVTVYPVEKLASNNEDKSRLYLSKEDMDEISIQNRAIQLSSKTTHNSSEYCKIGLHADPALRGTELFLFPTRVSNKLIIRRTVLKYHRKLNANPNMSDEEKLLSLALVSTKLSQWPTLVALDAAGHDSLQAYGGDDLIDTPVDISLFHITKRQRITRDNEDAR
jgi:hypothetical protein